MHPTRQKEKLTNKAKTYLESHYTEKFSLDHLAGELYINKNYLSRVFKETTGHTLLWYHNHLRCQAAKKLLKRRDFPIAIIAYKTGFASASHFSRIFKTYEGCSPSVYRRNLHQK